MKILLLAPQPFFVERGTPIAVRDLAMALCGQGHQVDLLALHDGDGFSLPGLRLFRAARPPFVRRIRIGFSPAKLLCDLFLAAAAFRLIIRNRYDAIHAVEEAIYPALLAKALLGIPVIHDMDSLMVDQIVEKWPAAARIRAPFDWIERIAARRADLVLAVCPKIAERVRAVAPNQRVALLPDIASSPPDCAPPDDLWVLRDRAGNADTLALYVGNLEAYQGVDLLIDAMAEPSMAQASCTLVIVGGAPAAIEAARQRAVQLGIDKRVAFLGPAPLAHLPWLLRQADILCSPRRKGINTPMKIYSYMSAARPILATDIESHTQVLDDDVALLVAPGSASMATGLALLIADPALSERLGRAAARRAREMYSVTAFEERVRAAYCMVGPDLPLKSGPGQK